MYKYRMLLLLICFLILIFPSNSLQGGLNEESKVEIAIEVLADIMKIPETSIPSALMKNTYAVAVIPGVIKAGFVIGGKYGQGILSVRKEKGEWSNPIFITITGGSVGFQAGVQSTDVILVFKNKRSVDDIIKGKFTLGADASVAAGPMGRQAGAATDLSLSAEIYSYSRSRGFFAGVALDGAILQIDHNANQAFYGKEKISPEEIIEDKKLKPPKVAERFIKELKKYSEL